MKVIVFPHELVMCGTVLNALDLAEAMRDLYGHDVTIFATPGPLLELVRQKRLAFVAAPKAVVHPSMARMRALRELVRREHPDLIHAWDWTQCLDAFCVEHLRMGIPLIATHMDMEFDGLLPQSIPATYGTPALVEKARAGGHRQVQLLVPPVDVHHNAPGAISGSEFRDAMGVRPGEIALVTVSRLDNWLKGESLHRTIDAVRTIGNDLPLRFIIVGDGNIREELERSASRVNRELGREAVTLAGALLDPRPAYAAADIVVGMGGSALRGMSFGKATVIVGERGFAAPFTPETAAWFYENGIYGVGNALDVNAPLTRTIRDLAQAPDRVEALGSFAREFVVRHFSIETACADLAQLYGAAVRHPRKWGVAAADGVRTGAVWLRQRRFLSGSGSLRHLVGKIAG